MATDKTFTVAGVSTSNDGTKVRFANDVMRVKVLAKAGHTDIILVELPTPMTKLDAIKFIADGPEFAGAAAQIAITEYLDKNTPKPKVERKPKATDTAVAVAVADVVTTTSAESTELDDQPY